ncbi:hypothetical protein K493DRAFT_358950 [Basidiobolus meristosporus CBS 931.73]|uniref:Uncharacterized protein n=1 Tax=Basidiobolus meristosporus CBS 931.73 TaxID=1314790 RepID=A0A1Y1XT07_9FUNG|nr:hypothetical protein K493DRAFT_358950 [Basidiobolus meristosporus CBS 931.73]|eukprot:ORX88870.1 hypothetical protein K493DRAFT_358950 [Basidiobolus meristosporus CBS 931.73]
MDSDAAGYRENRYVEIRDEVQNMLIKFGWKKGFDEQSVSGIPISGWQGNLLAKSAKMLWQKGEDVTNIIGDDAHVDTLPDALNNMIILPTHNADTPIRPSVFGIYKIKDVGDIIAEPVEQGTISTNTEVVFHLIQLLIVDRFKNCEGLSYCFP